MIKIIDVFNAKMPFLPLNISRISLRSNEQSLLQSHYHRMALVAKRGAEIRKSIHAKNNRLDKLCLASSETVKAVLARYAVAGETFEIR